MISVIITTIITITTIIATIIIILMIVILCYQQSRLKGLPVEAALTTEEKTKVEIVCYH